MNPHDDELREKEREVSQLKRKLEDKERLLAERDRDLETLGGWMEKVDEGVPALLNSLQWKAGYALGELYRRALRRPRTPSAANSLDNVRRQYRAWKGGSDPVGMPPARPEGAVEAAAGFVFRTITSRKSPAVVARELSDRAASAGKRRVRRGIGRLKHRMPRGELAREIRRRLGPEPRLEEWPFVSMVVVNRNGREPLEKLFAGLAGRTDYPGGFEVVLVDNGSTDGSVELARSWSGSFPVKVVENRENVSFSEGNNQGAEAAGGDLLLFLNNDVEPFEAGWLKEMVGCKEGSGAGAVGAYLLYPGVTEHMTESGYAVQHRGIKMRRVSGEDRPRNLGGDDALGEYLGREPECLAATAACLLMDRETFDSVGGFTSGYRYGSEDVDLCLKLLSSGRKVVSSGRAVLFHDESSTQDREGNRFKRVNRSGNRQILEGRWGPWLHRMPRLERLGQGNVWTEDLPHIAITLTSHNPDDGHGDWYTGHEFGDALERAGWRVSYVQGKRNEWYSLPEDLDYLLALLENYDISRIPEGIETIAWIRNWTERWIEAPWFEQFDMILASSGISKEIIERRTTKAASIFPLATNPKRFARTPKNPAYEADYVFTGSYWGSLRGIVGEFEVAPEETFGIFGKGWENVPKAAPFARGFIPYDELPQIYSSARLAIDDAAASTRPYGSVNSRVFDSLAAGTLVVTNCEAGARELFDEDFPTYGTSRDLRANLDKLLGDDERREELAERYRGVVLREHTYEKRAGQLTEMLRKQTEALSFCVKIGAPSWKVADSWGDLHFARAMKRQLERRGHPCRIQTLDEWDDFEGMKHDVAIHLKGLSPYVAKPGQFNVLWNISHPEMLTGRECDRYDLALVASNSSAERLKNETETPVHILQQATDPEVFFPDHSPEHVHELVFVGNSRRVERRILRDLLPTNRDLAVWGGDWEALIDNKHIMGRYLPNDQVRKAYSSAAIVLNDHWDDMREHGFVSNRIYDALACGALVISDDLPEIGELFGGAVVTYQTPEELGDLVEHYLSSPEEREGKGREGREVVLANHTFEGRVGELLGLVEGRMTPNPVGRFRVFGFRPHPSP